MMVNVGYLKMDEVPSIPRLPRTPAVTIFAPLGLTPVDPDAVLLSGTPGTSHAAARGRDTCAG